MAQRKKLLEDLEALNTIKNLAESYEEVAVVKMQKIKDSVLKTRDYLADLSDVFVDLKASYNREIQDLIAKRKRGDTTILPNLQKNGKTLMVYLASNGRLYGAVTQKTFRLFISDLRKPESANSEIAIIGSAGKKMFEASGANRPFKYFVLPDTNVEMEHIKEIMQHFMLQPVMQRY